MMANPLSSRPSIGYNVVVMVTLVFSSDPYLADQAGLKLYKKEKETAPNAIVIDCNVDGIEDLVSACLSFPLFEGKKVVLGLRFPVPGKKKGRSKKGKDDSPLGRLLSFIESKDQGTDLILTYAGTEVDESIPLLAAIKENGKIVNSRVPDERMLRDYASARIGKSGGTISDNALDELLSRVGDDYGGFFNEVDKLCLYADKGHIGKEDVEELVTRKLNSNCFDLIDAILEERRRDAFLIYADLLKSGYEEVGLLSLLANQLRFLEMVGYLDAKGLEAEQIAPLVSDGRPVKPARVRYSVSKWRRLDSSCVEKAMESLYSTQLGILKGEVKPDYAFSLLLLNIKLRR